MRKSVRKWKQYLCMMMAMILLTTSIGGCGFSGDEKSASVTDTTQESIRESIGEKSQSTQETKDPGIDLKNTGLTEAVAGWNVLWYVENESINAQKEILEGIEGCKGVQILLGGNNDGSWYAFENGTKQEVEHKKGTGLDAFLEQV